MKYWWRQWLCMMLAVIQTPTDAYISVNLALYCLPEGPPKALHLQPKGPHSAMFVDLNVLPPFTPKTDHQKVAATCRLEVIPPPGHVLTVHLDHPKVVSSGPSEKRQGFLPCFLRLSHTRKASYYVEALLKVDSRTVDLCSGSEITTDTLFITNHHLTLVWSPPDSNLAVKMVSKRLIITTFGKDTDSSEGKHEANQHHVFETILKTWNEVSSRKRDVTSTTPKPVQNMLYSLQLSSSLLRNMSDIILKKFLNKNNNMQVAEPMNTTMTTTIKPPWQDNSEAPTFPAVLAQYGPWGYLMLGMLICGAILMLCGLWECCCRSSKHRLPAGGPTSTSAATTVFIINSAGRMGHHRRNSTPHQEEATPTPGPPSYEELDQPPPYSSLFPVTKVSHMEPMAIQENHMITGQQI